MGRLVILHTNDIHSHFEQMPKITETIRIETERYLPDPVLVIDCGDHMDRYRPETEGSGGAANVAVMNHTGYAVAVPGNNEGLTFTPEELERVYARADFTVLGTNMYEESTGKIPGWMEPYRLLRLGPLNVAIIGLTIPFTDFYRLLGWDIRSPFETAAGWIRELRPLADLVIVVSHLGLSNDRRLAQEVGGIDVILGAHTHHLLEEPLLVENTYLCAAGKFGEHVGEVEIAFDEQTRRITEVRGRCIEVSGAGEDPATVRMIEAYREEAAVKLSEVVAELPEPLALHWDKESALGNIMAAGLRKWTGAEIGIVNSGQLLQGLAKGAVTRGQLHRICPSPVNPCLMRLAGKHLRTALEEALLEPFRSREIRGFGFRGKQLGTLCLDGLRVEYDPAGPEYARIVRVTVNGRPLESEKEYRVGTIDMFTFGVGYTSIREGRTLRFYLPEFLRDVLAAELQSPEALGEGRVRHWIPL